MHAHYSLEFFIGRLHCIKFKKKKALFLYDALLYIFFHLFCKQNIYKQFLFKYNVHVNKFWYKNNRNVVSISLSYILAGWSKTFALLQSSVLLYLYNTLSFLFEKLKCICSSCINHKLPSCTTIFKSHHSG